MSLHESEPKSILPFPEPKSDPTTLRSIGAVVGATLAYQSDVEGHIKEHGSEVIGLTFDGALARVTRTMTQEQLEYATSIRSMPETDSRRSLSGRDEHAIVSDEIARRSTALRHFKRYAVATFPERFGKTAPVSMERGQTYDVDGFPMNLPENTTVVPGDLPKRFRR